MNLSSAALFGIIFTLLSSCEYQLLCIFCVSFETTIFIDNSDLFITITVDRFSILSGNFIIALSDTVFTIYIPALGI